MNGTANCPAWCDGPAGHVGESHVKDFPHGVTMRQSGTAPIGIHHGSTRLESGEANRLGVALLMAGVAADMT